MAIENLITEHIDIWTSAIQNKSSSGRGSNKKIDLYGIKKLRELILELAVRGKLVAQDANDEPASVLLDRIVDEQSLPFVKKTKNLPKIENEEKPFDLPRGWAWTFLGDVCLIERGGSPRPIKSFLTDSNDGLNWIKIGDTDIGGKYITKTAEKIRSEGLAKTRKVFPGDFLLTNSMSFGRPYITMIEGCIHDGWLRISPPSFLDKDYLYSLLSSPFIVRSFKKSAAGAVVMNLNADKVRETIIALPPEKEQHRIVAKVDELMKLCDQLEQQTEDSIAAHHVLVETLLATLTNSANANELMENWQRISEHFGTLFTTEASIDQLKQTILQLAVMGKLVPQDPNDEPAAKLLERIAEEKAQLVKEGKIKKQKALPPIADDEKPFEVPEGWEWCRFGEYVNEVATGPFGSMINKREYIDDGVPLINPSHMIDSRILEDSSISVSVKKADELSSYKLTAGDIVMARRGEMGRCALVTSRENGWLCGTGSFVLKFDEKVNREYILLLFKSMWVREYLGGNSVGSTMVNLNHGILNKMPLLVPPLAEQEEIVSKVTKFFSVCEQLKACYNVFQSTQLQLTDSIVEQAI